MRYSAMPMRVPLFHSLAELMATMMRYYCHGEVPEAMLPALAASNGLASFVQLGLQYHRLEECYSSVINLNHTGMVISFIVATL